MANERPHWKEQLAKLRAKFGSVLGRRSDRALDARESYSRIEPSGQEPSFPFGHNLLRTENVVRPPDDVEEGKGFKPGTLRHWVSGEFRKQSDGSWSEVPGHSSAKAAAAEKDARAADKPSEPKSKHPKRDRAEDDFLFSKGWHGGSFSDEKTIVTPRPKWTSAGGVVLHSLTPEGLRYVYLVKPANNFGPWTLPKGRVDGEESQETTALREVSEEAGIKAKILPGGYLGKGEGTSSITHFYMMVRTGGNIAKHDGETERVEAFTFDEAREILKKAGNRRDPAILDLAEAWTRKLSAKMFGH